MVVVIQPGRQRHTQAGGDIVVGVVVGVVVFVHPGRQRDP